MIRLVVLLVLLLLIGDAAARAQIDVMTGLACAGDAFKFCGKTMKNGALVPDAIEACLRAHERSLSPGCRAAVNGHKR